MSLVQQFKVGKIATEIIPNGPDADNLNRVVKFLDGPTLGGYWPFYWFNKEGGVEYSDMPPYGLPIHPLSALLAELDSGQWVPKHGERVIDFYGDEVTYIGKMVADGRHAIEINGGIYVTSSVTQIKPILTVTLAEVAAKFGVEQIKIEG